MYVYKYIQIDTYIAMCISIYIHICTYIHVTYVFTCLSVYTLFIALSRHQCRLASSGPYALEIFGLDALSGVGFQNVSKELPLSLFKGLRHRPCSRACGFKIFG